MLSQRAVCLFRCLPWCRCRCIRQGSRGGSRQQRQQQQHRACLPQLHGARSCTAAMIDGQRLAGLLHPACQLDAVLEVKWVAQCAQAASGLGLMYWQALSVTDDMACPTTSKRTNS